MKRGWIIAALSLVWVVGPAQDRAELTQDELAAEFPGVDAKDVLDAAVPGMYEVAIGSSVAYVSKDGRYILQGDLYDLDQNANLTERRRSTARVEMLSQIDPASMIVFSPGAAAVNILAHQPHVKANAVVEPAHQRRRLFGESPAP